MVLQQRPLNRKALINLYGVAAETPEQEGFDKSSWE
jgi:hypothetical protein